MNPRKLCLIGIATASIALFSACGQNSSSHRTFRTLPSEFMAATSGLFDYQIGSTWGKAPVEKDTLTNQSPAFQRAAQATARIRFAMGGATGFVIGEKNGETLLATNNHVIGAPEDCSAAEISFEMLDIAGVRCKEIVVTNTDIDLTIITLDQVNEQQQQALKKVARSFKEAGPTKGTELLTIGYGIASNPGQKMLMAGQDEDCKTYSPDGEVRYMADPDEFNPGPGKTWMFAIGCDVSHGDSGSAIVERETGDVIGILSTGKIPKNEIVRDAEFIQRLFKDASEEVWSELTYAVPSSKILELIGDEIEL